MSLAKCLSAVDALNVHEVQALASPELKNAIVVWMESKMCPNTILYACKCFLLNHPHIESEKFLLRKGFDETVIAKQPCLLNVARALMDAYDEKTCERALHRAAQMPDAQMRSYITRRKMIDDLVDQCSNRDDRKNVKAKRNR